MKQTNLPHYYFCEGLAAIAAIPRGLSSESWSRIHHGFKALAVSDESKRQDAHLECYQLSEARLFRRVHWDEELANQDGASFVLLPMPGATPEDIEACEQKIRRESDVVRLTVLRPTAWADAELTSLVSSETVPPLPVPPPATGSALRA